MPRVFEVRNNPHGSGRKPDYVIYRVDVCCPSVEWERDFYGTYEEAEEATRKIIADEGCGSMVTFGYLDFEDWKEYFCDS